MDSKTNAEIIRELALASMNINDFTPDNSSDQVLMLPDNFSLVSLERFCDKPKRIEQKQDFNSLQSFCDYVNMYKDINTIIISDPASNTVFRAYIDYHGKHEPSWVKHTASFSLVLTDEWKTLLGNNKQKMSQRDFLNFIDDNAEIISDPDMSALLEEIKKVEVKKSGHANSSVSHNGEGYDSTGDYKIESLKTEKIEFVLSPAKYADTYRVKARLFCTVDESGPRPQAFFKYSLINHARVYEHMVDGLVGKVKEHTQIQPLI